MGVHILHRYLRSNQKYNQIIFVICNPEIKSNKIWSILTKNKIKKNQIKPNKFCSIQTKNKIK
jgi:hypothetical protein